MRKLIVVGVIAVVALAVFLGRIDAADSPVAAPRAYTEAKLAGDVLLVNLKSMDLPFILKSHEVVTLAGVPFLQGVAANIGDDNWDTGLTVLLAVDDIAVIHEQVKAAGIVSFYDEKGAVGRRYRRQDEAGTPFCVTVDGQTLEDNTVTIRDRDTLAQQRIGRDEVLSFVQARLG